MDVKHKVLKDFQLVTEDKKIVILKVKTIIENYEFKNKLDIVKVSKEIINNNPDYFSKIDWKEEFTSFLKQNKLPQPAILTKKIVPFIESLLDKNLSKQNEKIVEVLVEKPIEKIVTDQSLSIELENKINKLKLKEEQLDKEIKETNLKEIEAENKQKIASILETEYKQKLDETSKKEEYLLNKEQDLLSKESYLIEKETNLSGYVSRSRINEKVDEYQKQGFQMDFFRKLISEI
jgi:hypothetical protein